MPITAGQREFAQAKTLVPLSTLKDEQLIALLEPVSVEQAEAGGYIFRAGDTAPHHVYLLSGEVTLLAGEKPVERVRGGTDPARFPLGPQIPRKYAARAVTKATFVRIDSRRLNDLLTTKQEVDYEVTEFADIGAESDWMAQLLASRVMQRLPPGNIQGVMRRVDRFEVSIGDQIIDQGTAGDWFYMISSGRAVVTRDVGDGRPPVELAQLGPGDSFGEEALLSGRPRNCGVVMLSAGQLLRLNRQDFNDLIREPVARFQTYAKALHRVTDGARWLDVRGPDEHAAGHLPEAINLPLELLREHCGQLHPDYHYVLYSGTTGRSCAAAFLLTDRGYDVSVLQDGLGSVPSDQLVVEQIDRPAPPAPTAVKAPPPKATAPQGARPTQPAAALAADNGTRQQELLATRQLVDKARQRIAALEQEKQQAVQQLGSVQAQLQALRAETERSAASAAALREERERAAAERSVLEEQAARDVGILNERIAAITAELGQVRDALADATAHRDRLAGELRAVQAERVHEAERQAQFEKSLAELQAAQNALRAERDRVVVELQGRLEEQRGARDALSEQLTAVKARGAEAVRELEARLAEQVVERRRLESAIADMQQGREQASGWRQSWRRSGTRTSAPCAQRATRSPPSPPSASGSRRTARRCRRPRTTPVRRSSGSWPRSRRRGAHWRPRRSGWNRSRPTGPRSAPGWRRGRRKPRRTGGTSSSSSPQCRPSGTRPARISPGCKIRRRRARRSCSRDCSSWVASVIG